ncbi:hypothetical protein [Paenibacillus sedimenti]|uniref:Uncharacterized protein n=1 Tax=Paenibacillus sedimenti TaxID=2770274 RepID=A0A926KQW2_9BACL|nr:hypothetical protein [Paenibacillus sedimenti]MBD0382290.1 hypothetical protein [Paenibacillus sedimenti]
MEQTTTEITQILICKVKKCRLHVGEEAIEAVAASIRKEVELQGIQRQVEVGFGKCSGLCQYGCVGHRTRDRQSSHSSGRNSRGLYRQKSYPL